MMDRLSLRLSGARVLRDGRLEVGTIALSDGLLHDTGTAPVPEADLRGYLLLPGIVDLRGAALDRRAPTRPLAIGLAVADRAAAAQGITTSWLTHGWSWEGGPGSPDRAEAAMAAVAQYRPRALTDLRLQIRCETRLAEAGDRLIAALGTFGTDYVIFADHLPEALRLADSRAPELAALAESAGQSVEAFAARILQALSRSREVPRRLLALAKAFDRLGLRYGSHGDTDGATRDYFHALGARIAEIPAGRGAALVARAHGDRVLMPATDVLTGGCAGQQPGRGMIGDGLVQALVSAGAGASLPAAAWALADAGILSLPRAWDMISARPASIMGLADRGTLAPGKRADLAIVNAETREVEVTISGGRLAHCTGQAGARLIGLYRAQRSGMGLAAE